MAASGKNAKAKRDEDALPAVASNGAAAGDGKAAAEQQEVGARATEAIGAAEDAGGFNPPRAMLDAGRMLTQTGALTRESARLGVELAKVGLGRSSIDYPKGDKRFADVTWRENFLYRRVGLGYLALSDALERMVDGAAEDGSFDWRTVERARFAMSLLSAAVSPTNVLPGNPAALKRAFETGGSSVLRGLRNMAKDVAENGGMPRMVDRSKFELGGNLAVTPGAVVYRDEQLELMQYTPTTEAVHERPVVMIPPQVNKYYFMDIAPGRSFIEYMVAQGIQYFGISFRNPRPEHADWGFDAYVTSILNAMDAARDITGCDDINSQGLCAGGITQAVLLSYLAAREDKRVRSSTYSVTLLDFTAHGMIGMLQTPEMLKYSVDASQRKGVYDGRSMARAFAWLRPNDLVWNYVVNNWLMGNDPPAFDILAWNDDSTNLPARLHREFMDIFSGALMDEKDTMYVLGHPIDVAKIKMDSFFTGAETDHITPWRGCYAATQMMSCDTEFLLSSSGHIQSMVNPPGNPRMYYRVGPSPGPDPDEWLAKTEKHTGTWWPYWAEWLKRRSGGQVDAPKRLGNERHPAGDPAPGRYVREPAVSR